MGLAGVGPGGTYSEPPAWVDTAKAPGTTSQYKSSYGAPGWWRLYATGAFLLNSPNLQWLAVALLVWFLFPYDLQAAQDGWSWVAPRCAVHLAVVLAYHGVWHVGLYLLHWSDRPLQANRTWRWSKFFHNAWYSLLGVLAWTAYEAVLLRCYATGRLPHAEGLAQFLLACLVVPPWNDVTFYFGHRLLHIRPIYHFVHATHHRSTDVDPFAGLAMHPVEHLYYFAAIAPVLYFPAHPFLAHWIGYHRLLAPIGGHSGYEIHFNQSQLHYLHHRFFECNYGSFTLPLDHWFGTFREKLPDNPQPRVDAKAALGAPERDAAAYGLLVVLSWACLATGWAGHAAPLVAAFAPLVLPFLLLKRKALMTPFEKEPSSTFALHVALGLATTALPVFALLVALRGQPGASAACQLWGC